MNSRDLWNERYSVSDLVWTDTPNQFVETHLADLEPGAAIDLGSGEGRNAAWLAGRGWNVTAVDFSPVGLEKARTLASHKGVTVDFVEADVLTYQPTGLVDLVLISYLQVDQGSQRTVLEHARSWLASGGTLFVIAHDRSNVEHGYGGPPSADVCYTLDETVMALAGLEIDTAEVVERVVTNETGNHTARDTLVIARRPGGEEP